MYLEKVKVGRLLAFFKKFNTEAAKFHGGLKISNYISERVLSTMKVVAAKRNMPGKDGILSGGRQRISNKECYAILATMCAPKNLEEMQRKLLKSSWPPNTKHDYKQVDVINKNISDYKTDMLIYTDRFEEKFKLLTFKKKSQDFIPVNLFKKGGAMGNPGLADYFIGGLPEKDFGARVWMAVKEEERSKCKSWAEFKKLYMRVIEKMEKRKREEDINKQIFVGAKKMVKEEEAEESAFKLSRDEARKKQRLHSMQFDEDSTDEAEMAFDPNPDPVSEDDDAISIIAKVDESNVMDNLALSMEDLYSDELANLYQPKEKGETGVCFRLVDHGKCDRTDCPWSHKEEDVAKARKLKELRQKDNKFNRSKITTPGKHVSFNRGSGPYPKKT
jgi:hypothetical protein